MLPIDEGISLLTAQKDLTLRLLDEEDKEKGKIVLSGFRRLTNKVTALDVICQKIVDKSSTKALFSELLKIRSQFGENFYAGFEEKTKHALVRDFDKYEKLFDDLRIKIIQ